MERGCFASSVQQDGRNAHTCEDVNKYVKIHHEVNLKSSVHVLYMVFLAVVQ